MNKHKSIYEQVAEGMNRLIFGKGGDKWRDTILDSVEQKEKLIFDKEKDPKDPREAAPHMYVALSLLLLLLLLSLSLLSVSLSTFSSFFVVVVAVAVLLTVATYSKPFTR